MVELVCSIKIQQTHGGVGLFYKNPTNTGGVGLFYKNPTNTWWSWSVL